MSVQYTPVQVLQAARRAEAEGKMDYALQFYRHLVEHHGMTAEAQEAREGLFRIAEWRWGEARVTRRPEAGNAPPQRNDAQRHDPQRQDAQRQDAYGAAAAAQQHAHHQDYASEPPQHLPQVIAREAAKAAGMAGEPYRARYRGATMVANLVSAVGWTAVLTGVIVAVLAVGGFVADVSAGGLLGLPVGVLLGVPAAVIGLVLVVTGQLATAVFESANATLELLGRGGGASA